MYKRQPLEDALALFEEGTRLMKKCTTQLDLSLIHIWLSCCCEGACDMDVDLIFKIAAIGILVSVLNQVLSRSGRDEQATMTTLAGLVVVLMMVVQQISGLFELVKNLFGL